jgi:hypothetical protein
MEEADEALDAQGERDDQGMGPWPEDAYLLLAPPVEEPLKRNPPVEGLDGSYWKPSGNYTIVKAPEASDVLFWAETARRDGRSVGNCMFCKHAFREVDYERGWMVYGNCKLWCADATTCTAKMERNRREARFRPAMASSSSAPEGETESDAYGADIKKTWEDREAALAAMPHKKAVRIMQRRANRKNQPYTPVNVFSPFPPRNPEDHVRYEAFRLAVRESDRQNAREAAAQ